MSELSGSVSIQPVTREEAEAALLRVKSLLPEVDFTLEENAVSYRTSDALEKRTIEQEIANTLYREAIFRRTLKVRENITQP